MSPSVCQVKDLSMSFGLILLNIFYQVYQVLLSLPHKYLPSLVLILQLGLHLLTRLLLDEQFLSQILF